MSQLPDPKEPFSDSKFEARAESGSFFLSIGFFVCSLIIWNISGTWCLSFPRFCLALFFFVCDSIRIGIRHHQKRTIWEYFWNCFQRPEANQSN